MTTTASANRTVVAFEWVVALFIFIVLSCIILRQFQQRSDGDNSNDANNATSEGKIALDDEALKKTVILKLYQSEHIQEKIKCNQIRRSRSESITSCTTASTADVCQMVDEIHNESSDEDDYVLDEEEGHGVVIIHDSDHPCENGSEDDKAKDSTEKTVANLCAICLEEYREGDTIVWSSNKNCTHAFHRDCLTAYLVKVKASESYPCPCCRQNFFFSE